MSSAPAQLIAPELVLLTNYKIYLNWRHFSERNNEAGFYPADLPRLLLSYYLLLHISGELPPRLEALIGTISAMRADLDRP